MIAPGHRAAALAAALVALPVVGCLGDLPGSSVLPEPEQPRMVEATSLFGQPLERTDLADATRVDFEGKLAAARADLGADPDSADALVWVGRRLAYLGRYSEAIETFSGGVDAFPEDARFLRHRGHRYLSTRRLDEALADFERAAELIETQPDATEPDGLPNDRGIPTSSLHSNVWYHLALVHYLRGDFEAALPVWRRCLATLDNDDHAVASSYWLYMTLRRLGREREAGQVLAVLDRDLDVIENQTYHELLRLFAGRRTAGSFAAAGGDALDLSTTGYGIGAFALFEGRDDDAAAQWQQVVDLGNWPAFGHIAAEAELARLAEEEAESAAESVDESVE